MADRLVPHIEERLGHVAVDMGLLTREQVADINLEIAASLAGAGEPTTFRQQAMDMGYLGPRDIAAIEAEELHRRRLINGYEIIDLIGAGNVSTAYLAVQMAMEREVALKILHPRLATDPVFVHAYIAEAQAVSRFHHPNIVQGYDAGESNGFYYFSHEYLSGGSMANRIASGTADFSEIGLLTYLRQVTSALRHAWGVGVYHGDINPGNLLLDGQGRIKLANLGVPRVAVMRNQAGAPGFVRCGPDYAAPEQLDKPETVNAQTDIYSLGATFYHLSFGEPPFPAASREEVLRLRRENPMPSFSLKQQEAFSGKYLRLIHDMIDPDPQKRPADPEELAERLEKFHLAGADDLGGLARQVRQVGGQTSIRAQSQRLSARVSAPNPHHEDLSANIRIRRRNLPRGRIATGVFIAGAALLVLALTAFAVWKLL